MYLLILFMLCYFGASGGAFLFWLIGLGLVVVKILKTNALPWMALMGAVIGVLVVIAGAIGGCDYEPNR
jgi:hypothetical protein